MSPKSCITLCIIAIIYVLIATLAILSPHGNSYALDNTKKPDGERTEPAEGNSNTATEEPVAEHITLKNDDGVEIFLSKERLLTFPTVNLKVLVEGAEKEFTAASLKSIILWSGLQADADLVVALDSKGNGVTYRSVDLKHENNAYILYADANGNPLPSEYGDFCLYLIDGNHNGVLLDLDVLDFG